MGVKFAFLPIIVAFIVSIVFQFVELRERGLIGLTSFENYSIEKTSFTE